MDVSQSGIFPSAPPLAKLIFCRCTFPAATAVISSNYRLSASWLCLRSALYAGETRGTFSFTLVGGVDDALRYNYLQRISVDPFLPENVDPMLAQCWATVRDGGPTLNQHRVRSCYTLCLDSQGSHITRDVHPNVGTKLGQRRRRWASIVSTLVECFVFAVMVRFSFAYRCVNTGPSSQTLTPHWANAGRM